MVIRATLCWIRNGNKILLKKANRGISIGKWNGLGGKIEPDETPEQNIIREVFEESGLEIKKPFYHGIVKFYLNGNGKLDWEGHLFSADNFSGKEKSSGEGELKWFGIEEIPFDKMWDDDRYYLQHIFDGKKFDAEFNYDEENEKVVKHNIQMK